MEGERKDVLKETRNHRDLEDEIGNEADPQQHCKENTDKDASAETRNNITEPTGLVNSSIDLEDEIGHKAENTEKDASAIDPRNHGSQCQLQATISVDSSDLEDESINDVDVQQQSEENTVNDASAEFRNNSSQATRSVNSIDLEDETGHKADPHVQQQSEENTDKDASAEPRNNIIEATGFVNSSIDLEDEIGNEADVQQQSEENTVNDALAEFRNNSFHATRSVNSIALEDETGHKADPQQQIEENTVNDDSAEFRNNSSHSTGSVDNTEAENMDEKILHAGILVEQAYEGSNGSFQASHKQMKLYKLYNKPYLRYTVYLFVWLNLLLVLFEEPAVPGLALPYWATYIMEYFCLCALTLRLIHLWSFAKTFWNDKKNTILIIIIVLTHIDMILYAIFKQTSLEAHAIRLTRVLRPLYLINITEGRQLRRAVRNIRGSLPEIVFALALLLLMIALFSLFGYKLFGKRGLEDARGKPFFDQYFDVYFSLYVLTTTANNPDVWMPAYDYNAWSVLFFVIFMVICMHIYVSIFLAVVYKNYKEHLEEEVQKTVEKREKKLKEAFGFLSNNEKRMTKEAFTSLMKEVRPTWKDKKRDLIWKALNSKGNEVDIGETDFLMIADLLNVKVIDVSNQVHFLERKLPRIYLSWISQKIRQIVSHRYFTYFVDLVILANAFLVAFDNNDVEIAFLTFYNLEIALKFYTFGIKHFFRRLWNWFEFIVIIAATLLLIIKSSVSSLNKSQEVFDILVVLRLLRAVKIIKNIKKFEVIFRTVVQIGPALRIYGTIMFILYYMYAVVGMETFAGLINMHGYPSKDANSSKLWNATSLFCGNVKLKDSDFIEDRYCNNNFNDVLKSFKILFDLTVVNQWHVITQGFVLITNQFARIYFMSFHLICVIVVLNIFVAFILEVFIQEYEFAHDQKMSKEFMTPLERRIKHKGLGVEGYPWPGDSIGESNNSSDCQPSSSGNQDSHDDSRFLLVKQQAKNLETLLQQLFAAKKTCDKSINTEPNLSLESSPENNIDYNNHAEIDI